MGADVDNILKTGCWIRQLTFGSFFLHRVRYTQIEIIELLKLLWMVLRIRVCNVIYDISSKEFSVCFPVSNLINSQSPFIKSHQNSSGNASEKKSQIERLRYLRSLIWISWMYGRWRGGYRPPWHQPSLCIK